VTTPKLVGAILGFAGVCILFIGRISSLTLNFSLIMILSAFLWAVATIYYKRFLQQVDPFITNFFQLTIGALPLALFCLMTGTFSFPMGLEYTWIILYSSVGSFAIGWSIWLFLLKQEDATVLSGSSFIVPAIALLIGWQFMGENIGIEAAIGSALILGGVYLVNLINRQRINNQT
jgi:drug/metabolite transporter (DMT)-like permease